MSRSIICANGEGRTEFEVRDARTAGHHPQCSHDIFEEEIKGRICCRPFLRQLIRFIRFPPAFVRRTSTVDGALTRTAGDRESSPKRSAARSVQGFEKLTRQNIERFERACHVRSLRLDGGAEPSAQWRTNRSERSWPIGRTGGGRQGNGAELNAARSGSRSQEQLAAMRQQIADLAQRK